MTQRRTETARHAAPPQSRKELLAAAGARRRELYELVRHGLDDLEVAVPWEALYYPPEEGPVPLIVALLEVLEDMPGRIAAFAADLPATAAPGMDGPARDEVESLFGGIHGMIRHDAERLADLLSSFQGPGAPAPGAERSQRLCELGADLKGKYASALMGATASVVADGLASGVAAEPVLFPEKTREFRRTRELISALEEVLAALDALPEELGFDEVLGRWRLRLRVDRYALADLPALRNKIAALLKQSRRRALYSGDHHQIRHREILLSERINEMERLHQITWTLPASVLEKEAPGIYERLAQLLLEVAAILDVRLLQHSLGKPEVERLRSRSGPPPAGPVSLAGLLAMDDLRVFLGMLLSSVRQRASVGLAAVQQEPSATEPAPVRMPPPAVTASGTVAPGPPPAELRRSLERVEARLAALRSPTNGHWNALRLTGRLLAQHGRVPVDMYRSILPCLEEIETGLVPELEAIAPHGVSEETVRRLAAACTRLRRGDPTPAEMRREIPVAMETLLGLLEGLAEPARQNGMSSSPGGP